MVLRMALDAVAPIKIPSKINAGKEISGTAITHNNSLAAGSKSLHYPLAV